MSEILTWGGSTDYRQLLLQPPLRTSCKEDAMTVKHDPRNDDVRDMVAVAKTAAGAKRDSQYTKDALKEVKNRVARWEAAVQRAQAVLDLPAGDPGRLRTLKKAEQDADSAKTARADAQHIQFGLENWMDGKAGD